MSLLVIAYPSTLPAPQAANTQSAERRFLSETGGAFEARAFQKDRLASQQLAFTFSFAEAAIFRAWWETTLYQGAAWFASDWPMPQGGTGVRRFKGPPTWQLVEGYGWRVSATCEVRGTGELPAIYVAEDWLFSAVFPLDVTDAWGVTSTISSGYYITPSTDQFTASSTITAGTIVGILDTYTNWPAEQFAATGSTITAGSLDTVLRTYTNWPAEQFSATSSTIVSGSIDTILVQYSMLTEQYTCSSTITAGTLV